MDLLLPADAGGSDPDLRPALGELVRRARAIAPPPSDLPQWRGSAEDGYRRLVQGLRATIAAAVAALEAARDAA